MRLHGRVTASWKFSGSEAFVADSLLLVNRFFWIQRRKIHSAHDRPLPRLRLTLLSDLVCIFLCGGVRGSMCLKNPRQTRAHAPSPNQYLQGSGHKYWNATAAPAKCAESAQGILLVMAEKQGCMLDISLTEATAAQKHWATSGHCAATATRAQSTLDLNHPPTHGSSV